MYSHWPSIFSFEMGITLSFWSYDVRVSFGLCHLGFLLVHEWSIYKSILSHLLLFPPFHGKFALYARVCLVTLQKEFCSMVDMPFILVMLIMRTIVTCTWTLVWQITGLLPRYLFSFLWLLILKFGCQCHFYLETWTSHK